jgi:hypothetical protein
MTKLASIELDDCILDAMRDNKLVLFNGTDVSMGLLSNLASVPKLVDDIADKTSCTASNPLNKFLGQLHYKKVHVHERAAKFLSQIDSVPNSLHFDLIRLFRSVENLRLVTTNFDQHFETIKPRGQSAIAMPADKLTTIALFFVAPTSEIEQLIVESDTLTERVRDFKNVCENVMVADS